MYKDECILCFETPISPSGIYVCLSSLNGYCKKHLSIYVQNSSKTIFLNIRKVEKPMEKSQDEPPGKKPTIMAIGLDGGFDVDEKKIEYEEQNTMVITDLAGMESQSISLPNPSLPLNVQLSIAAVVSHQGAALVADMVAWQEQRVVSKHALNLLQLDNGVKIPPNGWQCSMCDLTENLWLNLTDGTLLCGRKYFDGSGGNGHALDYFKQTGYPLTVKLGTITSEGGDVYSYDEDDMVVDPKLTEHLAHFGINVANLEKTDKTMTELEIEANMSLKAEWDLIQEAGKKLAPCYGPGFTGMINLGNSCYMNSVMQVLFTMPEFISTYADCSGQIFQSMTRDPADDFNVQMAKLANGLLSGEHSQQPVSKDGQEMDPISLGIRPQMFKALVGRGHPEFSTNHQQDAEEYFLHLLDVIEKKSSNAIASNPVENFAFQFEDRVQCSASKKVSYTERRGYTLPLPVPLEAATNRDEFNDFEVRRQLAEASGEKLASKDLVRLRIPMSACIQSFENSEKVKDFYSEAVKSKTTADMTCRFRSFPDYLVVQMRKFTISEDWTPKKLDVSIDVEQILDLSHLRGTGLQPGEEEMPALTVANAPAAAPVVNEEWLGSLMDMGFPLNSCKRAIIKTKNASIDAAMNWIFEHSQDADFADPIDQTLSSTSAPTDQCKPEDLLMITSMGFTEKQARNALKKNQYNVEMAANWIFSNMDSLDDMEVDVIANVAEAAVTTTSNIYKDGNSKYELFAFVSHMGTSTSCGHYVCHIKKNGSWVIFNDRKVAASENPPFDLGYLYFYRRL